MLHVQVMRTLYKRCILLLDSRHDFWIHLTPRTRTGNSLLEWFHLTGKWFGTRSRAQPALTLSPEAAGDQVAQPTRNHNGWPLPASLVLDPDVNQGALASETGASHATGWGSQLARSGNYSNERSHGLLLLGPTNPLDKLISSAFPLTGGRAARLVWRFRFSARHVRSDGLNKQTIPPRSTFSCCTPLALTSRSVVGSCSLGASLPVCLWLHLLISHQLH
jgi:hypothetical protein